MDPESQHVDRISWKPTVSFETSFKSCESMHLFMFISSISHLQASAASSFDMRCAVGQQWTLSKNKDAALSSAYTAVGKSYSAQRAFRQKWAQDRFDELREEREKSEEQATSYGKFGFALC